MFQNCARYSPQHFKQLEANGPSRKQQRISEITHFLEDDLSIWFGSFLSGIFSQQHHFLRIRRELSQSIPLSNPASNPILTPFFELSPHHSSLIPTGKKNKKPLSLHSLFPPYSLAQAPHTNLTNPSSLHSSSPPNFIPPPSPLFFPPNFSYQSC